MPIIQPDLSEAADLSPIPEGSWPAVIAGVEAKKSKKGQNMLELSITVKADGKEKKRKFWAMIEGAGASSFDNLLRACKMDELADQYKDPDFQPKPPFDTDTLINQEVVAIVVPEIYQAQDGNGNPVGTPEVRDRIKSFLKA